MYCCHFVPYVLVKLIFSYHNLKINVHRGAKYCFPQPSGSLVCIHQEKHEFRAQYELGPLSTSWSYQEECASFCDHSVYVICKSMGTEYSSEIEGSHGPDLGSMTSISHI